MWHCFCGPIAPRRPQLAIFAVKLVSNSFVYENLHDTVFYALDLTFEICQAHFRTATNSTKAFLFPPAFR